MTSGRQISARLLQGCLVFLWCASIAAGFGFAWRYESTPATQAPIKSDWPGSTSLSLNRKGPTLVLFAHPACPCTKVSLEELRGEFLRSPNPARLFLVLVEPKGFQSGEAETPALEAAKAFPGATIIQDREGKEATRFGATTSGQLIAYNAEGRKLFSGGVTAARGHYGESTGLIQVSRILEGSEVTHKDTPVFGCSLLGEVAE